jgi:hypothetical protein
MAINLSAAIGARSRISARTPEDRFGAPRARSPRALEALLECNLSKASELARMQALLFLGFELF